MSCGKLFYKLALAQGAVLHPDETETELARGGAVRTRRRRALHCKNGEQGQGVIVSSTTGWEEPTVHRSHGKHTALSRCTQKHTKREPKGARLIPHSPTLAAKGSGGTVETQMQITSHGSKQTIRGRRAARRMPYASRYPRVSLPGSVSLCPSREQIASAQQRWAGLAGSWCVFCTQLREERQLEDIPLPLAVLANWIHSMETVKT